MKEGQNIIGYQSLGDAGKEVRVRRREIVRRVKRISLLFSSIVILLSIALFCAVRIRDSAQYAYRTTQIKCVDSASSQVLSAEIEVLHDGGLDDDPNKAWSVGPDEKGTLVCKRNVWLDVKITVSGYEPVVLRLDEKTPGVVTVPFKKNLVPVIEH